MAPVMLFDKIVSLTVRRKMGKRWSEEEKKINCFFAGDAKAVLEEWHRPWQVRAVYR